MNNCTPMFCSIGFSSYGGKLVFSSLASKRVSLVFPSFRKGLQVSSLSEAINGTGALSRLLFFSDSVFQIPGTRSTFLLLSSWCCFFFRLIGSFFFFLCSHPLALTFLQAVIFLPIIARQNTVGSSFPFYTEVGTRNWSPTLFGVFFPLTNSSPFAHAFFP